MLTICRMFTYNLLRMDIPPELRVPQFVLEPAYLFP